MRKVRKTTIEECTEIVAYCIELNYECKVTLNFIKFLMPKYISGLRNITSQDMKGFLINEENGNKMIN